MQRKYLEGALALAQTGGAYRTEAEYKPRAPVVAKESSVAQYNFALKHFEPFAASRGETVEACIAFVSADGTIKDATLKAFNAFLLAAPARVSSSVYANCIKLCGNQNFTASSNRRVDLHASMRRLPDGVAMVTRHTG